MNKDIQTLKEEFEENWGFVRKFHIDAISLWNWIESKLSELESKARREAVEDFIEYVADNYYLNMDIDLTVDGNLRDMLSTYLQAQPNEEAKQSFDDKFKGSTPEDLDRVFGFKK